MRRALPVAAILVLALAALGVVAAILGGWRGRAYRDASLRSAVEGPMLVLHGVDVREIRPGGTTIRFRSERASYAILARHLSAEDVTVALPAPEGEIVVEAPLALWDMDAGIVLLPEGGRGGGAGGWSATVPEARLDLSVRQMTASGASLSGPGVSVAGRDLVWKWKDGTLTLEAATGSVLPGKASRRDG
jgi:hypothetical protein